MTQDKKKISIFDAILNIIIILLTILVVYWFIQLIFGGSPGLSEFNFTLIVLLGSFLIKIHREVGEIKVEMKHVFNSIKDSFINIKDDMDLIKKKLKIEKKR